MVSVDVHVDPIAWFFVLGKLMIVGHAGPLFLLRTCAIQVTAILGGD